MTAFGCGDDDDTSIATLSVDDDVDTATSQMISSCQPDDPYYTDCHLIDLSKVDYWQDDLNDPDWRDVRSNSHPEIDYVVDIDLHYLNGGVIPTQSGQGDYEDYGDYQDTKSDLLGVDLSQDKVVVTIDGSTVKQAKDGGPVDNSTGVLVYDALSDEDGKIFIDETDETENIINPDRERSFSQDIDDGTESTTIQEQSVEEATTAPMTSFSAPPGFPTVDSHLLQDSNRTADLRLFLRIGGMLEGHPVHGGAITDVSGPRVLVIPGFPDPPLLYTTRWTWNSDHEGNYFSVRHEPIEADLLRAKVDTVPDNIPDIEIEANSHAVSAEYLWPEHGTNQEACGYGHADFDIINQIDDEDWVFSEFVDPTKCNGIPAPPE